MARNYLINKHMDNTSNIRLFILSDISGSLMDGKWGGREGRERPVKKEKVTTHLGAGSNKKITALPPSNYLQVKTMPYLWAMPENTGKYLCSTVHDRHSFDTIVK